MQDRKTTLGFVICLSIVMAAALFMVFSFNGGFFFFTPFIPAIFIFVICIIVIGAASSNQSRQRRSEPYPYYYHYQNRNHQQQQIPVENPYKVKPIKLIDDSPKVEEEESNESKDVQFCMFCGIKIDRDAVYCHQCGTRLK
ncbi:MAG: hypothetical protein ACFE85_06960 [Candidatus Hodarchaeota archaeon]